MFLLLLSLLLFCSDVVQSLSCSVLLGEWLQNWEWPKSHRWTSLHVKLCPTQKRRRHLSWPSKKKVIPPPPPPSCWTGLHQKTTNIRCRYTTECLNMSMYRFYKLYIHRHIWSSDEGRQMFYFAAWGAQVETGNDQQIEESWFNKSLRWK